MWIGVQVELRVGRGEFGKIGLHKRVVELLGLNERHKRGRHKAAPTGALKPE